MNPGRINVRRGICYAQYAYDVGLSIDLEKSRRLIATVATSAPLRHNRRAPKYFDYDPAPLRLTQEDHPLPVGAHWTETNVDLTLYDFGGISVSYAIPFHGGLDAMLGLSCQLSESDVLVKDSRRRVELLLPVICRAVTQCRLAEGMEDYAVFQIEEAANEHAARELLATCAGPLAGILRAEPGELSEQEVADAVSCRLAFGPNDLTLIDWNAAVLFDRDADDVRAVLEFANQELLELRVLDRQLDGSLDRSYERVSRTRWWKRIWPGFAGSTQRQISQMQVDGALLFERVSNAPKLLGDQYLARVYRLAAQRFHLAEWNAGILRKLDVLESIFKQVHERAASRRLEVLEWIIILLILLEIIMALFPGWFAWGHHPPAPPPALP